jgi:hypothetical protein
MAGLEAVVFSLPPYGLHVARQRTLNRMAQPREHLSIAIDKKIEVQQIDKELSSDPQKLLLR